MLLKGKITQNDLFWVFIAIIHYVHIYIIVNVFLCMYDTSRLQRQAETLLSSAVPFLVYLQLQEQIPRPLPQSQLQTKASLRKTTGV